MEEKTDRQTPAEDYLPFFCNMEIRAEGTSSNLSLQKTEFVNFQQLYTKKGDCASFFTF